MIKPKVKPSFDRLQYTLVSELSQIKKEIVQEKWAEQVSSILKDKNHKWDNTAFLQKLYYKPYRLFIWENDSLIFWNSEKDLSFHNINRNQSDYHYAIREVNQAEFRIEILYPIIGSESHIVNPELLRKSGSSYDFIHVTEPSPYHLTLNNKQKAFHISPTPSRRTKYIYIFLFSLYGLSLVFFLIFLLTTAIQKAKSKDAQKLATIGIFLLSLLIIKLTLRLLIPSRLGQDFILFSETNSFAFHHSIADFLITGLLIFIGVIGMNKILLQSNEQLRKSMRYWLIPFHWSIIIGFLLIISAIRGVVLDTNMHFNVEEIYNIDKYSLLSITVIIFILFSLFNLSNLFSRYTKRFHINNAEKVLLFVISVVLSIPIFYLLGLHISIYVFYGFIMIYFLLLDLYMDHDTLSISWLVFWMVVFSGFTSVIFYNYSLDKEIIERKRLIKSIYIPPANEDIAYISQLQEKIEKINLGSSIRLDNQLPLGIRQYDFIQYVSEKLHINRNINIEVFDTSGTSLFLKHYINEERFLSSFLLLDSISTHIQYDPFTKSYLLQFNTDAHAGNSYLCLFTSKENFYNKIDKAFKNKNNSSLYILSDDKMLYTNGNFEVHSNMHYPNKDNIRGSTNVLMGKGQLRIDYTPRKGVNILSYKKIANIIKPISFFSYIFSLIGFLILIALLINYKYNFLAININFNIRHSLRLKIQFTVMVMIIISFVLVGVITSLYFQNLIKEDQFHDIKEKTETIQNYMNSIGSKEVNASDKLNLITSNIPIQSKIHDTELVLFSNDGKLMNTSNTFYKGALMNYPTWLDYSNNSTILDPKHNKLKNDTWESYIPIYDREQFLGGILVKHPKTSVLSNSILDFFSTLLNVYVFLFLLAVFIAIAVSNSITKPLKLLASKMMDLKLGKQNEMISWKGTDEIGLLIHRYNEMLTKIENSAQLLAKTQRDQAWREMAKQVAHEIKNPLTPMKLSMQYLEKMVVSNPDRAMELIPRISKTLIEQIDNLTGIANAFSNFAKMPKATNQKILLNDVVETTHDLFRERDDMDINLIEPIEDIYVFADKNHLVRILNNLLKNAMQAIPEDQRGKISIELYCKNELAIIKVTDNGTGIPDHMLDKVFTPNFTTKSSGTGLGLPIVANMIETFNGKIYFETEVNVGTSFYVEIPKMRMQNMEKEGERVSLD